MKKNLNINENGRVPVHDSIGGVAYFKNSDVNIMLDHDFTEVQYTIKYFGFADIMSKIGGIVASLNPVMGILAPMLIIFYLSTLSQLILDKNKEKYEKELVEIYKEFQTMFKDSIYLEKTNTLQTQVFSKS